MAASVLLNFSNAITFSPADPLLGLVRNGSRLLAYEQLSVEAFSKDNTERKKQIRREIGHLRNMLENLSLSEEDRGERIRLIFLLDFTPWNFLKPGNAVDSFDASFPSLKLEYLKTEIEEVCGSKNPLLPRFDYVIIFVDEWSDKERSKRYRLTSYHGFSRMGISVDWLSRENIKLNEYRDEMLKEMGNADASLPLSDPQVLYAYKKFQDRQLETISLIKKCLAKIGKDGEFDNLNVKFLSMKTVGEFVTEDYDYTLKTLIREVAGLGASRFRDTTCFMMTLHQSVASLHCKDSIVLKSLIQLLCTIDEEQFKTQFRPANESDSHKLFIMPDDEDSPIQAGLLRRYHQLVISQGKLLGGPGWADPQGELTGMCWSPSKEVEYEIYSPGDVNAEGAFRVENEAVNMKGNEKLKEFKNKRRVPFFFGATAGDWAWYRQVLDSLKACMTFEEENKRPNVEEQKRQSDSEMEKTRVTVNYGELGRRIKDMPKIEIESSVNYESYIANRKKDIDLLAEKAESLKKELVKLGIRSRFLWIAGLTGLVFIVCFAFHSFYVQDSSSFISVPSGLAAFLIVFILSAFIARWIVKERILDVYRQIDSLFKDMQDLAREHLKSVYDLAEKMSKADADRKTLTEMKTKYSTWAEHNKKVEIWVVLTRNMKLLLDDALKYLALDRERQNTDSFTLDEEILDSRPAIVPQISSREEFKNMKPQVIITTLNRANTIENVSCFVSLFKFSIEQFPS